jgi:hypothetical protein
MTLAFLAGGWSRPRPVGRTELDNVLSTGPFAHNKKRTRSVLSLPRLIAWGFIGHRPAPVTDGHHVEVRRSDAAVPGQLSVAPGRDSGFDELALCFSRLPYSTSGLGIKLTRHLTPTRWLSR